MQKKVLIVVLVLALSMFLFNGCAITSVRSGKGVVPFLIPTSSSIRISDDGSLTITTDLDDNAFNSVYLQVYQVDPFDFVMNIHSSLDGIQKGVYTHELDTGEYILRLKGNSNLKDEGVDIRVFLVSGKSYLFNYNVSLLSDKMISIKDFVFGLL